MPGSLDSCISNVYEDGNIPASVGTPPVRVLLKEPIAAAIAETAAALDATGIQLPSYDVTVDEAAAATDAPDIALVPRQAMLLDVFVNSDGTPRQANANGVMVNL